MMCDDGSSSADEVFNAWVEERKEFFDIDFKLPLGDSFGGIKSKIMLPVLRDDGGVPKPSFLLHDLGHHHFTKVEDLLACMERSNSTLFPVPGCHGAGKTRMAFELLSSKYGVFFKADQKKSGGSKDISQIICSKEYGKDVSSASSNSGKVEKMMQAAILARLMIFAHCKATMSGFSPLRWLLMQTYFGQFVEYDPFCELSGKFSGCHNVIEQIKKMWKSELIWVLDDAQVLCKAPCLFSSSKSSGYSTLSAPIISALLKPTNTVLGHPLVIFGTYLDFLKQEPSFCVEFVKTEMPLRKLHTFWTKDTIKKFMNESLSVDHDVVEYLMGYCIGRRRSLITAVERVLVSPKAPMDSVTGFVKEYTEEMGEGTFYQQIHDLDTYSSSSVRDDEREADANELRSIIGGLFAIQ